MPATYIHLIHLQPLEEHTALQYSRLTNEDSQFYSEKLLGWLFNTILTVFYNSCIVWISSKAHSSETI